MILSVCPNPSIDCTIEVKDLNVGRLNRVENKSVTYAGKAFNAAIGVARLGEDSFLTGFMYDDNGKMFVHKLDDENVQNTFIWNKGGARTNYKIVDRRSMMTEINDKGEEVSSGKQKELISLVKQLSEKTAVSIMSGSLPLGVDDEFYYKLCNAVSSEVKKIVDTTGNRLLAALKAGVYLVKPNIYELTEITGEEYTDFKSMIKGCEKIIGLGAENVLLSLGKDGAIITDGIKSYYCKSANVAVNSTVGAGDSMVAAAAVMISFGESPNEILRSAVAAGTASVTTPGTNLFYRDKFEEIYAKLTVEEIL